MKKIYILLLGVAALGACKKDNGDSPTPTASRTDLLTAHKWKPSSGTYTISYGSLGTSNDAFDACDKDDAYTFNTDKSLVADAGAIKCSTSDPQQEKGTWALSSNDQKLTLNLPNQAINGDLDIKELTTTTLHVTGTQSFNGATITIDATFVAY